MTKEQVYDEMISPLMAQIIAICKEHEVPLLASFSLDMEAGLFCTTALLSEKWEVPDEMVAALRILRQPPHSPLMITTRDGNGNVTRMDAIL